MGPVRRPHLPQACAAPLHDVRNAKFSADFDQFPPGYHGLAVARERVQDQENRRRVVVDDERILGAREAAQEIPNVVVTQSSLPPDQVELEIRIARTHLLKTVEGIPGQGSAAEVGVDDDARGIDHLAQPAPAHIFDASRNSFRHLLNRGNTK